MYPFFDLFGRQIPLYGVMCVVAAFVSVGFAVARAKRFGVDSRDALYMCIFAIIGAIAGAKAVAALVFLAQAVLHMREIAEAGFGLWDVFYNAFASTGIVFFGGLIGGAIGGVVYLKKYKLRLPVFFDLAAPCIPVAHAIGRIGCFLAGCCYGIESRWGVEFANSPAAPPHVRLLPVQLIEADANLCLAAIILIYERLRGEKNGGKGKNLLLYLVLYPISRFTLEFLRGDAARGLYFGISTSQIISIVIFVPAIYLFFFNNRKGKNIYGR
ncbi:MAG: prolipoprotein diacylglyceryl transferase [Oscillospiraceae bacterium]|nr:prolipoprotein diacylglyceryl transferase [Oscillospiraceae bacterium]